MVRPMANSSKKRTYVLTDLETREVSLVDVAANKRKFAFKKNDGEGDKAMDEKELKELLSACIETELEGEAEITKALEKSGYDKRGQASIKAALKLLAAHKDDLQASHKSAMRALATEGRDDDDDDDDDKDGKKAAKNKAAGGLSEEAMKGLPAEVQAHFALVEKARQEDRAKMAELEKAMKQRDEADQLRVCVAKAKSEFPHLVGHDELGSMLQKAQAAGIGEQLEKTLRAANERAKMGGTKELLKGARGTTSDSPTGGQSAEERVKAKSVEVAKASSLTIADAISKVFRDDPALYDEYEAERKEKIRQGG